MATFYGYKRLRLINREALEELNANCANCANCAYVVFGLREFNDKERNFVGVNKDLIAIFVTSREALIKLGDKGYRRVFVVPTLMNLTYEEIQEALSLELEPLRENLAIAKLIELKSNHPQIKDSLDSLSCLAKGLQERDVKVCSVILGKHWKQIIESSNFMQEAIDTVKGLRNTFILCKDLEECRMQLARWESSQVLETQMSDMSKNAAADTHVFDKNSDVDSRLEEELTRITKEHENAVTELTRVKQELGIQISNLTESLAEQSIENKKISEQRDLLISDVNLKLLEINKLKEELSEEKRKCAEIHENALKLGASLLTASEQLNEAQVRIARLEEATGGLDANTVIAKLKSELAEASKSKTGNEQLKQIMPIIGDTFPLEAKKILLIKELKPAIYMNSFLSVLSKVCGSITESNPSETFCILVLDRLNNEFREFKYRKRGFTINSAPGINLQRNGNVLVTNTFDIGFLKNTLKIGSAKYLIVVDRLGLRDSPVKHNAVETFYMIDSRHDVNDFAIKGSHNLIVYGKLAHTSAVASISPTDSLYESTTEDREFTLYRQQAIENMLIEAGVKNAASR